MLLFFERVWLYVSLKNSPLTITPPPSPSLLLKPEPGPVLSCKMFMHRKLLILIGNDKKF